MSTETAPKKAQDSVTTAADQTLQSLLQLDGEAARHHYFTLTGDLKKAADAAAAKLTFPAKVQQARAAEKAALLQLTDVNTGAKAIARMERPDAPLVFSTDADATARLLLEFFAEKKTEVCSAAALCVRRAMGQHKASAKGLASTVDAQAEAAKTAVTSRLRVKIYTEECNIFIVEQTPETHPARKALTRKTRRREVSPLAATQTQLVREQGKAKRLQVRKELRESLQKAYAAVDQEVKENLERLKDESAPDKDDATKT